MIPSSRATRLRFFLLASAFGVLVLAGRPSLTAAELAATQTESSTFPVPQPRAAYVRRVAEQTRAAHAGPVRLLFVGDSITASWMRTGPGPRLDLRAVWDRFYGDRQAFDIGIGGDRTENVLWRLQQGEVDGLNPRLTVLMIGTNNIGWHQTAPQVEQGIDRVVQELHARMPQSHILVLGILPRTPEWMIPEIETINRWLATRYTDSDFATFADIGSAMLKNGQPDPALYAEGADPTHRRLLHPDAAGAERIARALEPYVSRLLGDRNKLTGR